MWNAHLARSAFIILSAASFAVGVVANPQVLRARQGSVHHHIGVIHNAHKILASTTSSATDASPTPIFLFLNDNAIQPRTCQSVRIMWFYGGPSATVNLYVTNDGVSQAPAPSLTSSSTSSSSTPSTSRQPRPTNSAITVTKAIGTNIDLDNFSYNWSSVDVSQGWYILNASVPAWESYSTVSSPFYVFTGSNTSCLSAHSSSTTNSVSHTPTIASATFAPMITSSAGATQGNGSPWDPMPLGAILGASLGGFALLVVIVIFYFWYIKRRRGKSARIHGGGSSPHHWKLGSADSRGSLRKVGPRSHKANDSVGTVIYSDEAGGVEKSSIESKRDSTVLSHEPEYTVAALPALTHASLPRTVIDRPRSTTSLTSNNLPLDDNELPPRTLVHHASGNSVDSMTYPPVRDSFQHIPIQPPAPSTTAQDESVAVPAPITPDPEKKLHRQSTGRKRKPVPIYDGNEDFSTLSSAPVRPISASALSPTEAFIAASPLPNGVGHYVTRNQSSQEFRPELAHKNSFGPGVKPLHYILPDMPPLPK